MQGASYPEYMQNLLRGIVQAGAVEKMQQDMVAFQALGRTMGEGQQILPEALQTSPESAARALQADAAPGSQTQPQPDPAAVQQSPLGAAVVAQPGAVVTQPGGSPGSQVRVPEVYSIPVAEQGGQAVTLPRHCPATVR